MIHHINEIPLIVLVILTFAGAFVWFVMADRLWHIISEKHRNYFMRWIYLFSGASLYTGWCMIMIPLFKTIMEKF
jgi:hypothetical protein